MAILYGTMNVDERYAPSFEPNLYRNTWLVPGITYTDKYQTGPAGAIYVHKYTKQAITAPGTPGRDFSHEAAADTLVPILINNNFQKSRKLYGVQVNAIEANAGEALMADTASLVRDSIAASATACIVTEGTADADTTAVTDANVRDVILKAQATLAERGASSATTLLVSPKVYASLLASTPNGYTPTANDEIIKTGIIRNYFGFDAIIRCAHMASGNSYSYYDSTGKSVTVNGTVMGTVDFVAYNPETFSVVNNLEVFRMIDGGKDFNGILAQAEVNTGFRVTNADAVLVHKHA